MAAKSIDLTFGEQDIEALHHERYHHPNPRVRLKMEVLLLKSYGLPHGEIARLARVSLNTLRNYLREYARGDIARLKELRAHRPQSKLVSHLPTLGVYFREHPPTNVREAMAKVEELTGIKRRPTQTRWLLKTLGLRLARVGRPAARSHDCN